MHDLAELRRRAGYSQAELARRAGVSRQLVGSIETGRHLPRVDAALALATALGTTVDALFADPDLPIDALTGEPPADGAQVRAGRIADRVVTAPAGAAGDGWDIADAVMSDGRLVPLSELDPGIVVAGCEPGLHALEQALRESGMGAVAIGASTAAARRALAAGRVHAAVVHGAQPRPRRDEPNVVRFGLAAWRVGLAAPPDAAAGWWERARRGQTPVIQREEGAGVQRTFEASLIDAHGRIGGPRVRNHLDAARCAVVGGMPAVTIEPAALAHGAQFHALEVHVAELWVARQWLTDRAVAAALDVLTSRRFQQRLAAVGGYDLTSCGAVVA